MTERATLLLDKARITDRHVEFTVLRGGVLPASLRAFVRGVLLGETGSAGAACATGDVLRLPIIRFPHVELPCEIRFGWGDMEEAASALRIEECREVLRLAGPGRWSAGELRIAQGMIRGSAINSENGCSPADFVCRVQGGRMRPVTIEALTPLEQGGVKAIFSAPVELGDISAAGVVYEVLDLDGLAPVARLVLAPLDVVNGDAAIRAARAVADIERRVEAAILLNQKRTDKVLERQERMLEQALAYLSSLIFDRLADPRAAGEPDGPSMILERLLSGDHQQSDDGYLREYAVIEPGSPMFGGGWLAVEANARRTEVCWMEGAASLLNPAPERVVRHLMLAIDEAAENTMSALRAYWDGEEAEVVAPAGEITPGSVVVRPSGGPARLRTLSLVARPNPQSGRSLALAEVRVVFET